MAKNNRPGIFVEEMANFPPTITSVETSVPAFIGYTEKAESEGGSLLLKPTRITSVFEYEKYFGGRKTIKNIEVILDDAPSGSVKEIRIPGSEYYLMYHSLRLFFGNGGGSCFIVSVGLYGTAPAYGDEADTTQPGLRHGLKALENFDGPTLILFPDAVNVETNGSDDPGFYHLQQMALQQCAARQDRFCIFDLKENISGGFDQAVQNFRDQIGSSNLEYGAAYTPFLINSYAVQPDLSCFSNNIKNVKGEVVSLKELCSTSAEINLLNAYSEATDEETKKAVQNLLYRGEGVIAQVAGEIKKKLQISPPSGAIAGIYAMVDSTRGVWKAPANISVNGILGLTKEIHQEEKADLNVHNSGKSINAIRPFPGVGFLVWGARTLAGNDNEWRYVAVRRFFIMVKESVKRGCAQFKFESNDANTWTKVQVMIENYLIHLWRDGGLAGAKPEDAFFVKVGLGKTMTAQDVLEGRMNIEIGLSAMRPAEFIIFRICLRMGKF